ncbi:hypothetical protein RCL1_004954 [Eukaryota sp. TZLM3-RCL]
MNSITEFLAPFHSQLDACFSFTQFVFLNGPTYEADLVVKSYHSLYSPKSSLHHIPVDCFSLCELFGSHNFVVDSESPQSCKGFLPSLLDSLSSCNNTHFFFFSGNFSTTMAQHLFSSISSSSPHVSMFGSGRKFFFPRNSFFLLNNTSVSDSYSCLYDFSIIQINSLPFSMLVNLTVDQISEGQSLRRNLIDLFELLVKKVCDSTSLDDYFISLNVIKVFKSIFHGLDQSLITFELLSNGFLFSIIFGIVISIDSKFYTDSSIIFWNLINNFNLTEYFPSNVVGQCISSLYFDLQSSLWSILEIANNDSILDASDYNRLHFAMNNSIKSNQSIMIYGPSNCKTFELSKFVKSKANCHILHINNRNHPYTFLLYSLRKLVLNSTTNDVIIMVDCDDFDPRILNFLNSFLQTNLIFDPSTSSLVVSPVTVTLVLVTRELKHHMSSVINYHFSVNFLVQNLVNKMIITDFSPLFSSLFSFLQSNSDLSIHHYVSLLNQSNLIVNSLLEKEEMLLAFVEIISKSSAIFIPDLRDVLLQKMVELIAEEFSINLDHNNNNQRLLIENDTAKFVSLTQISEKYFEKYSPNFHEFVTRTELGTSIISIFSNLLNSFLNQKLSIINNSDLAFIKFVLRSLVYSKKFVKLTNLSSSSSLVEDIRQSILSSVVNQQSEIILIDCRKFDHFPLVLTQFQSNLMETIFPSDYMSKLSSFFPDSSPKQILKILSQNMVSIVAYCPCKVPLSLQVFELDSIKFDCNALVNKAVEFLFKKVIKNDSIIDELISSVDFDSFDTSTFSSLLHVLSFEQVISHFYTTIPPQISLKLSQLSQSISNFNQSCSLLSSSKTEESGIQAELEVKESQKKNVENELRQLKQDISELGQKCRNRQSSVEQLTIRAQRLDSTIQSSLTAVSSDYAKVSKILESINYDDVIELRALPKPPLILESVFDCLFLILGLDYSWDSAKKLIGKEDFLGLLLNFDKDTLSPKVRKSLSRFLSQSSFSPSSLSSISPVAETICSWILAIVAYHDAVTELEPKKQELVEAENELTSANYELKTWHSELSDLELRLSTLSQDFSGLSNEVENLSQNLQSFAWSLENLEKLLEKLESIKFDWQRDYVAFESLQSKVEITLAMIVLTLSGFATKSINQNDIKLVSDLYSDSDCVSVATLNQPLSINHELLSLSLLTLKGSKIVLTLLDSFDYSTVFLSSIFNSQLQVCSITSLSSYSSTSEVVLVNDCKTYDDVELAFDWYRDNSSEVNGLFIVSVPHLSKEEMSDVSLFHSLIKFDCETVLKPILFTEVLSHSHSQLLNNFIEFSKKLNDTSSQLRISCNSLIQLFSQHVLKCDDINLVKSCLNIFSKIGKDQKELIECQNDFDSNWDIIQSKFSGVSDILCEIFARFTASSKSIISLEFFRHLIGRFFSTSSGQLFGNELIDSLLKYFNQILNMVDSNTTSPPSVKYLFDLPVNQSILIIDPVHFHYFRQEFDLLKDSLKLSQSKMIVFNVDKHFDVSLVQNLDQNFDYWVFLTFSHFETVPHFVSEFNLSQNSHIFLVFPDFNSVPKTLSLNHVKIDLSHFCGFNFYLFKSIQICESLTNPFASSQLIPITSRLLFSFSVLFAYLKTSRDLLNNVCFSNDDFKFVAEKMVQMLEINMESFDLFVSKLHHFILNTLGKSLDNQQSVLFQQLLCRFINVEVIEGNVNFFKNVNFSISNTLKSARHQLASECVEKLLQIDI